MDPDPEPSIYGSGSGSGKSSGSLRIRTHNTADILIKKGTTWPDEDHLSKTKKILKKIPVTSVAFL
jgi:hypothetical protein